MKTKNDYVTPNVKIWMLTLGGGPIATSFSQQQLVGDDTYVDAFDE